jgi:hypothetical protein
MRKKPSDLVSAKCWEGTPFHQKNPMVEGILFNSGAIIMNISIKVKRKLE